MDHEEARTLKRGDWVEWTLDGHRYCGKVQRRQVATDRDSGMVCVGRPGSTTSGMIASSALRKLDVPRPIDLAHLEEWLDA